MLERARVPVPIKRIRWGTVAPLKREGAPSVPEGTGTVVGTMGTVRAA